MRVSTLALGLISVVSAAVIEERTYPVVPGSGFSTGEPIDGNGKGGPILGNTFPILISAENIC